MVFEDFTSVGYVVGCIMFWTNEPKLGRVCFEIGNDIFRHVLQPETIHDNVLLDVCKRERSRVEAACRRAFARQPSAKIKLQPADFAGGRAAA